jgi:hypothetical protein
MQDMGRYAEAEELAVRAVELREAVLGPGHPATASSLNNLAALYKEQVGLPTLGPSLLPVVGRSDVFLTHWVLSRKDQCTRSR